MIPATGLLSASSHCLTLEERSVSAEAARAHHSPLRFHPLKVRQVRHRSDYMAATGPRGGMRERVLVAIKQGRQQARSAKWRG